MSGEVYSGQGGSGCGEVENERVQCVEGCLRNGWSVVRIAEGGKDVKSGCGLEEKTESSGGDWGNL